jgi:hypothetical protein
VTPARDTVHMPDILAIKVAQRALVRQAGGGEGAAATVGARQQRMSDCGNPNTPDFLRADEIAKLEDVTVGQPGHPIVTRVLAKRQGFELVREPTAPASDTDMLKLLAHQAKEHGDVSQKILEALADQKWTVAEAADVESELDDVIALAVAMRAEVRLIKAEGGRG